MQIALVIITMETVHNIWIVKVFVSEWYIIFTVYHNDSGIIEAWVVACLLFFVLLLSIGGEHTWPVNVTERLARTLFVSCCFVVWFSVWRHSCLFCMIFWRVKKGIVVLCWSVCFVMSCQTVLIFILMLRTQYPCTTNYPCTTHFQHPHTQHTQPTQQTQEAQQAQSTQQ